MKLEQLIVQHFYAAKQVTLQGIGTFTLSPDFVMPFESDKDFVMPENAIRFEFNKKAQEDETLINFIVQQTRKIKPLAISDLESYLALNGQFLNIGKPFEIPGIGILEKNQIGEYQFSQSFTFQNTTKKPEGNSNIKEKAVEKTTEISFSKEAQSSGSGKKIVAILASLVVLAGIVYGAWYFLNKKNESIVVSPPPPTEQPQILTPSSTDTVSKDTSTNLVSNKPDSISKTTITVNSDYSFKVVLKNYPSLALAQKSYDRLTSYGHKLLLYTSDSVIYKVAMPISRPLADTTYAKDSIRKQLFGGNPYIELN